MRFPLPIFLTSICAAAAAAMQLSTKAAPPDPPNPNRVITTTDPDTGISYFNTTFDESLAVTTNLSGALLRPAYVSDRPPQILNGSDLAAYSNYLVNPPALVIPGGGAVVWYIDTPPGASSPLHRTISLDFVIIVEGTLQLTLNSGDTRILTAGDTIIQRGTTHMWTNIDQNNWLRMVGVMAAIEPVTLNNGTQLAEYFPS